MLDNTHGFIRYSIHFASVLWDIKWSRNIYTKQINLSSDDGWKI